MKSSFFWAIALFAIALTFSSCGSDKNDVRDQAVDSVTTTPAPTAPGAPAATTNTSGVHHYVCPKNCAGSGGASAGTCPVCGSEYTHNQAFHNTPGAPQDAPVTITPSPATPAPTTPATPEPAQNAAGVWHYTCPKGCAGGGGSATACAKCGTTLAHNSAYHQ